MSIFSRAKKIHLLGIEGSGMKGLAYYLSYHGYQVSGSDLKAATRKDGNISFYQGHQSGHVVGKDLVLYSTAVNPENEELTAAKQFGIPTLSRAYAMAQLLNGKPSVAVSGIHGKTTTTGMIGKVLIEAGLDPTVIVGGVLKGEINYFRGGSGSWNVYEADESDGSISYYHPQISVITNIELEHVDYFKDLEHVLQVFRIFIQQTSLKVIMCIDDTTYSFREFPEGKIFTYGFSEHAQVRASVIKKDCDGLIFSVMDRGVDLGEFRIPLYGQHHIQNAMAAICVGRLMNIPVQIIRKALAEFQGMERRFQIVGQFKGASIINDYAHHPQEVKACLDAARQKFKGKILGVFQPHRFSRFRRFMHEFAEILKSFDAILVAEIYHGFEKTEDSLSAKDLCDLLLEKGLDHVSYCSSLTEIVDQLRGFKMGFDAILIMGAGDIDWVASEVLRDGCASEKTKDEILNKTES